MENDPAFNKFLTGCKNQQEKAVQKLKNYREVRKTTPELFQNRDPNLPNLETLLNKGAFYPIPVKSGGHTLLIVKAGVNDPKTIPMMDVFKLGIMSVDLLMETDDDITRTGVCVVVDLKGVGLGHGLQMTPRLVRKVVHLWQDCYPIRVKGIDFVNCPRSVDVVLNIFKLFMSESLKSRVRTHGDRMESLHSIVDGRYLPEDYGGSLGPERDIADEWKRKVQSYREWFLNDQTVA